MMKYIKKTDDEEEKNNINEESIENEEEDEEEKEEEKEYNNSTTNDSTGNNNNNSIDNAISKEDKKKSKKKLKINNYKKEIIERKDYIYNNISIENIKFSSSKEENYLSFYFDLNIPYSQKNILLKKILNIVLKRKISNQ